MEGATEALDYESGYNATEAVCATAAAPAAFYTSAPFHALVAILYGGVLLAGVAGNALVCAVVRASPRMRTVNNYFIVNLALADILMALLCVPATSFSQLIARAWPWGGAACRAVNFAQAVSVLVSAYTLVAVSAHRAAAVLRPLRPRPGAGAARAALAVVWLAALATAAPIPLVSGLVRPTLWHRICQVDICAEQWGEAAGGLAHYTAALLALQFGVPLLALAGSHARIALAVYARRAPGEAQHERDSHLHSSKRKMVKMMVMVVVVFTVCWLPFNVLMVAWTTAPGADEWSSWEPLPYVWFATHWLAMSHCCYNPFIYCYMNARYRQGFKQAIRRVLCLGGAAGPARRPSTLNDALVLSELVRVRRGPVSSSALNGKRRDDT